MDPVFTTKMRCVGVTEGEDVTNVTLVDAASDGHSGDTTLYAPTEAAKGFVAGHDYGVTYTDLGRPGTVVQSGDPTTTTTGTASATADQVPAADPGPEPSAAATGAASTGDPSATTVTTTDPAPAVSTAPAAA